MQRDHEHEQDNPIFQEKKRQLGVHRRRFLKQSGLAAGAATVFSFLGITPFASARTAPTNDITGTTLDASQAKPYIQAVMNSSDYHRFQQLVQQNYPQTFTIQEQKVAAVQVSSKEGKLVFVHIPVAGGFGYSFYSAIFQPQTRTLLQAHDALFTSIGGNTIDAYVERDGQVVFHEALFPDGRLVNTGRSAVPSTSFSIDWGCVANCLGIPVAVALAIAWACSLTCALTAGWGCAVCLVATGALGQSVAVGVVFYCLSACTTIQG